MKKTIKTTISLVLVILFILGLAACNKTTNEDSLWENAYYTADTTLGSGENTFEIEVKAGEKAITFTISSNEKTVGAAMVEQGLISGDNGDYGLYVKNVNGITADFDVDQSYWAFNIDGEYATSGVDTTEIKEGVKYQLVYTK